MTPNISYIGYYPTTKEIQQNVSIKEMISNPDLYKLYGSENKKIYRTTQLSNEYDKFIIEPIDNGTGIANSNRYNIYEIPIECYHDDNDVEVCLYKEGKPLHLTYSGLILYPSVSTDGGKTKRKTRKNRRKINKKSKKYKKTHLNR